MAFRSAESRCQEKERRRLGSRDGHKSSFDEIERQCLPRTSNVIKVGPTMAPAADAVSMRPCTAPTNFVPNMSASKAGVVLSRIGATNIARA
jgi:hypothetical protein